MCDTVCCDVCSYVVIFMICNVWINLWLIYVRMCNISFSIYKGCLYIYIYIYVCVCVTDQTQYIMLFLFLPISEVLQTTKCYSHTEQQCTYNINTLSCDICVDIWYIGQEVTIVHYHCVIDGPDEGEVRLYGDYYCSECSSGRLEVFLSDVWGTVAGSWTKQNAVVACRQMGFESECIMTSWQESVRVYNKKTHIHRLSEVSTCVSYCTTFSTFFISFSHFCLYIQQILSNLS